MPRIRRVCIPFLPSSLASSQCDSRFFCVGVFSLGLFWLSRHMNCCVSSHMSFVLSLLHACISRSIVLVPLAVFDLIHFIALAFICVLLLASFSRFVDVLGCVFVRLSLYLLLSMSSFCVQFVPILCACPSSLLFLMLVTLQCAFLSVSVRLSCQSCPVCFVLLGPS